MTAEERSIQFRVVVAKKVEVTDGPDDADTVATIALADAEMDPSVAFMRGKLKITGPTGPLFDALSSGRAKQVIADLVERASTT
jgi:putative sterol carrier protein